jgi:phosphoribosylanthranilate isomerase
MITPPRRPWPLIKVCGIQSVKEGLLALSAGANTIGLLVGLKHKAEDEIDIKTASAICHSARNAFPSARVVLVTSWTDPLHINAIARAIGVTAIQIEDAMTPAALERLGQLWPEGEVFKTVSPGTPLTEIQTYAPYIDAFLVGSPSTDSYGNRPVLSAARTLIQAFPDKPIILAGSNSNEAIRTVCPAGIDAHSGLEDAEGHKDVAQIKRFAAAGRACRVPPSRPEQHAPQSVYASLRR